MSMLKERISAAPIGRFLVAWYGACKIPIIRANKIKEYRAKTIYCAKKHKRNQELNDASYSPETCSTHRILLTSENRKFGLTPFLSFPQIDEGFNLVRNLRTFCSILKCLLELCLYYSAYECNKYRYCEMPKARIVIKLSNKEKV